MKDVRYALQGEAHVAARIMSLAEPGDILTSAVVPLLVEGGDLSFDEQASTERRGLPGDRTIYRLNAGQ